MYVSCPPGMVLSVPRVPVVVAAPPGPSHPGLPGPPAEPRGRAAAHGSPPSLLSPAHLKTVDHCKIDV